jgi:hypothetical protein
VTLEYVEREKGTTVTVPSVANELESVVTVAARRVKTFRESRARQSRLVRLSKECL